MTNHPFDLKGIDTSKIGGNKYVDYKLSDYVRDQGLNQRSADSVLKSLDLNKDYLKRVPKTSVLGKIETFLGDLSGQPGLGQNDYFLPKSITDRLAAADMVKEQVENFANNPYGDYDKMLEYDLKYKKAADIIDRKKRATDFAMELAATQAQLPMYEKYFDRISKTKQRDLLLANKYLQGLPDAIQDRIGESAIATSNLRNSLANVQNAATGFAGLGMQRPFGQPTFRVS